MTIRMTPRYDSPLYEADIVDADAITVATVRRRPDYVSISKAESLIILSLEDVPLLIEALRKARRA